MAQKKVFGLTSVLMGAIANDGGMGTTLTELLGRTAKDSASLIYTPPSTSDVEIEESDDPDDTLTTAIGTWELKFDSYNVAAKTMSDVCGGTYTAGDEDTPDTWESPDPMDYMEKSFRVTTRNGAVVDLPRVKYIAAPNLDFAKSKLGTLKVTGKVMKPTKSGVKSVKFTDPS